MHQRENYQDLLEWGRGIAFKSFSYLNELGFFFPKNVLFEPSPPHPSTIMRKRVTIDTKMPGCKFKVHRFTFSFSRFKEFFFFSLKTANKLK